MMGGQFAGVAGCRPVHGGLEILEQQIPIHRSAEGHAMPHLNMIRALHHLEHMIARAESERFQSILEREGAGSSKPGANYFQCHPRSLSGRDRFTALRLSASSAIAPGVA